MGDDIELGEGDGKRGDCPRWAAPATHGRPFWVALASRCVVRDCPLLFPGVLLPLRGAARAACLLPRSLQARPPARCSPLALAHLPTCPLALRFFASAHPPFPA